MWLRGRYSWVKPICIVNVLASSGGKDCSDSPTHANSPATNERYTARSICVIVGGWLSVSAFG